MYLSHDVCIFWDLVMVVFEIEIYPLQKSVLKDIISPMGCNRPVVVVVSMGGLSWRQTTVWLHSYDGGAGWSRCG